MLNFTKIVESVLTNTALITEVSSGATAYQQAWEYLSGNKHPEASINTKISSINTKIESIHKPPTSIKDLEVGFYKQHTEQAIQRVNNTYIPKNIPDYFIFIDFLIYCFGGNNKIVDGPKIADAVKTGTMSIKNTNDLDAFEKHLDSYTTIKDPILEYTPYTQFLVAMLDSMRRNRIGTLTAEQAGVYFLTQAIEKNWTLSETIKKAVEYAEGIKGFDASVYIVDPTIMQNDIRTAKIKIKNTNNQAALFEIHNLLLK